MKAWNRQQGENSQPAILEGADPYILLVEKLEPTRAALLSHPVYKQLDDLISLRLFMESHIFAVWDFMALIKTLQREALLLFQHSDERWVAWIPDYGETVIHTSQFCQTHA